MSFLIEVIKTIGGPGSLGFFLAALVLAGVAYRYWPAYRRLVMSACGVLVVGYGVLALPVVALGIVNALPVIPSPDSQALRAIQALVVFDGDNRTGRQRRTHQILRVASPATVWLLGPEFLLADVRVAVGPGTTLHHDPTTWNTAAQVERVRDMAGQYPALRTAVIASRVQMPRVAALFDAADTAVLLIASPLDREPASAGLQAFRPSLGALTASRDAIYEHAALAWYRWRGDLR